MTGKTWMMVIVTTALALPMLMALGGCYSRHEVREDRGREPEINVRVEDVHHEAPIVVEHHEAPIVIEHHDEDHGGR